MRLRYTHGTYLTEPNETNANLTPTTIVTIPYIKGTSEIVARILQPYNIRVAHRPITNLRKLLTNVKDKDQPKGRQGTVYKIKCCYCQATYIGETGRNFEHKRATRNGDINNTDLKQLWTAIPRRSTGSENGPVDSYLHNTLAVHLPSRWSLPQVWRCLENVSLFF